ncbi:MAG: hypothetical protein AUH05_22970 [Ktedonobacter sp. 13_2_20CM_53_11]|nr:MAG: hypothetical protein AUH05_22970 [Ktedonobacter sp. 13_2_20CM_53_11]
MTKRELLFPCQASASGSWMNIQKPPDEEPLLIPKNVSSTKELGQTDWIVCQCVRRDHGVEHPGARGGQGG